MTNNVKVTYANFICDIYPLKINIECASHLVATSSTAKKIQALLPSPSLIKIMLNSVISDADKGARYCTANIKNFYLNNPMKTYRYMNIPIHLFTDEILKEHNINKLVYKGYVYVDIRKGTYGLKESGILAYTSLVDHLQPFGYYPVRYTPGLWRHKTTYMIFTLAVNDFGIPFYNKFHAEHLFKTLRTKYEISVDWIGNHYCGLTIDWNYDKAYVDILIPGYVQAALQRFQHPSPTKPQHAPRS